MIARTKQQQRDTEQKRKRNKGNWEWFLKKFDGGNYQDRVIVNERKEQRERRGKK